MQTRFRSTAPRIRYARPSDLAAITTMLADPEVGRWLWFVPASPGTIRGYFEPIIDGQWQALADARPPTAAMFVAEDDDGNFLGEGGALAVDGSAGGFEIGYCLPSEAWRRGIGTAVAEFLLAWVIREHGAYRVQAGCLAGNDASAAILAGLGLQREGTLVDYRQKGEIRHTEWLFGARVSDLDADLLARIDADAAFDPGDP